MASNGDSAPPGSSGQGFAPGYVVVPQDPVAAMDAAQKAEAELFDRFWAEKMAEIEAGGTDPADFKSQQLPLARIKKIMKSDEDVRMISAEAPVLFAKACELFIAELTKRAWIEAQENSRRTVQRSDVTGAVHKTDIFDFLIDVVPKEEGEGGGAAVPQLPTGVAATGQPGAAALPIQYMQMAAAGYQPMMLANPGMMPGAMVYSGQIFAPGGDPAAGAADGAAEQKQ